MITKRILIPAIILTSLILSQAQAANRKQGACKNDVDKLCASHKGNRQAMRDCIRQNKDNFSPECKAQRNKPRASKAEREAKRASMLQACAGDVQKLCPEANQPGAKKNAPLRCLMLNREKLSPDCQATLPKQQARRAK